MYIVPDQTEPESTLAAIFNAIVAMFQGMKK